MCMADDADPCSFWQDEQRRAKKAHKCDECGREIASGEIYRYCKWIFEREWSTSKMCGHCDVAAKWLLKNCGGFLTHGIYEDIQEHVDEYSYLGWRFLSGLGRLQVGMRRDWKIQWGPRSGQLMALPRLPPAIDEKTVQP